MLVQSSVPASRAPRPPYTLDDLAGDAFGLLDHLGLDSAHIVGVSMGGMIVQTMALLRPERVRSMTSIMSTTGRRTVGWQDPRLLPLLLARSVQSRQAYVDSSAKLWKMIGSPGYRRPGRRCTTGPGGPGTGASAPPAWSARCSPSSASPTGPADFAD